MTDFDFDNTRLSLKISSDFDPKAFLFSSNIQLNLIIGLFLFFYPLNDSKNKFYVSVIPYIDEICHEIGISTPSSSRFYYILKGYRTFLNIITSSDEANFPNLIKSLYLFFGISPSESFLEVFSNSIDNDLFIDIFVKLSPVVISTLASITDMTSNNYLVLISLIIKMFFKFFDISDSYLMFKETEFQSQLMAYSFRLICPNLYNLTIQTSDFERPVDVPGSGVEITPKEAIVTTISDRGAVLTESPFVKSHEEVILAVQDPNFCSKSTRSYIILKIYKKSNIILIGPSPSESFIEIFSMNNQFLTPPNFTYSTVFMYSPPLAIFFVTISIIKLYFKFVYPDSFLLSKENKYHSLLMSYFFKIICPGFYMFFISSPKFYGFYLLCLHNNHILK